MFLIAGQSGFLSTNPFSQIIRVHLSLPAFANLRNYLNAKRRVSLTNNGPKQLDFHFFLRRRPRAHRGRHRKAFYLPSPALLHFSVRQGWLSCPVCLLVFKKQRGLAPRAVKGCPHPSASSSPRLRRIVQDG